MTCPYCGGTMQRGEITTNTDLIRWVEEGAFQGKFGRAFATGLVGKLLSVPSIGFRAWIPADFCPKCKKMIFDTEIMDV